MVNNSLESDSSGDTGNAYSGSEDPETAAEEDEMSRRDVLNGVGKVGVVAGSTLIAGCTGDDDGEDTQTPTEGNGGGEATTNETVHFLSLAQAPKFREFWDRTAASYEEEAGYEMEITYAFDTGYTEKVARQLQAGDPPEIIQVEGFSIGQYITQDLMEPVTDIVSQFNEKYDLPQNMRFNVGGEDRWYPSFTAPTVHWYRGDQMEENGYSGSAPLGTPATLEEYQEFYETMDGYNDMDAGMVATAATDWGTAYNWSHLWQNGIVVSDIEDGETAVALDDQRDELKDYLERYKSLYDTGSPNTGNYSWTEAINGFTNARAHEAMYLGARHKVQSIRKDRDWADQVLPGPVPTLESADETPYFGSVSGWGILEPSDAKEGAKGYIQSIMMDEETHIDFLQKSPVHNSPVMESWWDPDHPVWDTEEVNEGFTDEQLEAWFDLLRQQTIVARRTEEPNLGASNLYYSFGLGEMMYEYCNNGASADEAIDTGISVLQDSL